MDKFEHWLPFGHYVSEFLLSSHSADLTEMMMFGFQQNQLFKLISRAQLLRKVWKMQLSSAAPNFARGFLLNKYQEIFATTSMPNFKKVVW